VVVLLSPLIAGVLNRLNEIAQSKRSPSILQPYGDLCFHKDQVFSSCSSRPDPQSPCGSSLTRFCAPPRFNRGTGSVTPLPVFDHPHGSTTTWSTAYFSMSYGGVL